MDLFRKKIILPAKFEVLKKIMAFLAEIRLFDGKINVWRRSQRGKFVK